MSEIAGNASVLIAAECLSNFNGGKGLLLGGIAGVSTTNILIIGAGTVGELRKVSKSFRLLCQNI